MFNDRRDAGIRLARELEEFKDRKDVIILALPRGGVVVAYEIARALHVPLDVFVVRKLGFPGRPELAIGAVWNGSCRPESGSAVDAAGFKSISRPRVGGGERGDPQACRSLPRRKEIAGAERQGRYPG